MIPTTTPAAVAAAAEQLATTMLAVRGTLARRAVVAWLPDRDPTDVAADLVRELMTDGDVGAAALADVCAITWPTGLPGHADPWWITPLGALVRAVLRPADGPLTGGEAGRLLGVTRARVGQLVAAGRLERHPDGGVTRASVMALHAQRSAAGGA